MSVSALTPIDPSEKKKRMRRQGRSTEHTKKEEKCFPWQVVARLLGDFVPTHISLYAGTRSARGFVLRSGGFGDGAVAASWARDEINSR